MDGVETRYYWGYWGDVIGLLDNTENQVVSYRYNSWGKPLATTDTTTEKAGTWNPFRYRGYCWDEETELYYVGSRYYDPEVCRFISPDTTDVLGASPMSLTDKNLYAYCDNNPVIRKDKDGKLWIATVAIGVGTQYIGDVIRNILEGKKGADIFKPTSTIGEYMAAGLTALIPGTGIGAALVRNILTEGIVSAERAIKGKKNSLIRSISKVTVGTLTDVAVEKVANAVTKYISSKTPANYSSYAGKQYKKNPIITPQKIRRKMARSIRWGNRLSGSIKFLLNSVRSALPW